MNGLLSRHPPAETLAQGFGSPAPVEQDMSLAGGLPADEALPIGVLRRSFESTMQDIGAAELLQYSDAYGAARLRYVLMERMGREIKDIAVTNGALHGLSLTLQALVNPGDLGFVESPCYPYSSRAIKISGARIVAVPLGPSGIDTGRIAEMLAAGLRPKFFYCVPVLHNPSGVTSSIEARRALSALARKYRFVVIADMAYNELGGMKMSDDTGFDPDVTIELWTFSKTLGPGLRIGSIVGPSWIIERSVAIRSSQDQHSNVLTQHVVASVLEDESGYEGIVERSRVLYRSRLDLALDVLATVRRPDVSISSPAGGLFLWLGINERKCDVEQLQSRARSLGTDFALGSSFDPLGRAAYRNHLRIGVANGSVPGLRAGLHRLRQALAEFSLAEVPCADSR